MLELRRDFQAHFGERAFDDILALQGEEFRSLEGRRTLRCISEGKRYFVKIHLGIGWKEIFKNLLQFRLPVLGAENEWQAIRRLEQLGVATMKVIGFGKRGWNPARLESFIITEELENTISLEDFCKDWAKDPPSPALKRALIGKVAQIARSLHQNGVNHRDFYLCHFLLDRRISAESRNPGSLRLYLIDLHRMQLRRRTPRRWIVKDVAGLYFSSLDIGLTHRDLLRFLKIYCDCPLREVLIQDRQFLSQVTRRAVKLYRKTFGRTPRLNWKSD